MSSVNNQGFKFGPSQNEKNPKEEKTQKQEQIKQQKQEDSDLDEEEEKDIVSQEQNFKTQDNQYLKNQKKVPPQVQKKVKQAMDFIFNGLRDSYPNKPYHEDGDQNLYTEEVIKFREQLKLDSEVKKQIEDFMKVYQFDESGRLWKHEYLKIHKQIAELLREDIEEDNEESEEELNFLLEQDWVHDCKGQQTMSKQDLYDSLFELVDIWTPDAEKEEYLEFFEILKQRIIINILNEKKVSQEKQPNQNQMIIKNNQNNIYDVIQ